MILGGMSVATSSLMRRRMQSLVSAGSILAGVSGGMRSGIDEGEDVDQVLDAVLDRRAGHGPAAVAVRGRAPPGPSSSRWFLMRWASSSTTTSKCTRSS